MPSVGSALMAKGRDRREWVEREYRYLLAAGREVSGTRRYDLWGVGDARQ